MLHKYEVTETFVVGPYDNSIRTQGEEEELTLFTCAEKEQSGLWLNVLRLERKVLMENRTRYRLGEVEEKLSEMEFEDRCDEIVEIDDDMQLVVSGWYVLSPVFRFICGRVLPVSMTKKQVCICPILM